MKKIEITPVRGLTELIIDALCELGLKNLILTPVINMKRDHMLPRWGDWDIPPPDDHRTKIEIIVPDNQEEQTIEAIQEAARKTNFFPRYREHGNEIFISPIEKAFCIQTGEHGDLAI